MYKCQECGRKFKTTKAAQRASDKGCPGCGGVDIDLAVPDRCCLCGISIRGHGHNPAPVAPSGRCCDACNDARVMPARFAALRQG